MARGIETGVEATPIQKTFPQVDEPTLRKSMASYDRNPSSFIAETIAQMEEKGDGDLLDLIEGKIGRMGEAFEQALRVSLIAWKTLEKMDPSLPPAIEENDPNWYSEPQSPLHQRENHVLMLWIAQASQTPGSSSLIRESAMTIYSRKKAAFNIDRRTSQEKIKSQR